MKNSDSPSLFGHWKQDFLSSVVVFFVALPLCMGVAIASGAPVAAGLLTGIIGGIVAGTLAGAPLQVSGPAAGLTVIVYELIQQLGLDMLGIAVLIAGGMQITAGALRLGQWFRAVSPAVIGGMLAGIGVLIFASQFHVMVDDKPRGSGLENLKTIPAALAKGLGVPRLAGEAERDFRTQSMKQLANLHHDQVQIQARVDELIPYHHAASATTVLDDVVEPRLSDWVDEQQEVSKKLDGIEANLRNVVEQSHGEVHLDKAQAAITEAKGRLTEAAASLEEGRAVEAVAAQNAAVAAIDAVSGRMKNHRIAASLGILTILIIIFWQKLAPKRLRLMPAPLLAILIATTIAAVMTLPVYYVELPSDFAKEIRLPSWTLVQSAPWADVIQAGALIAIVASAETLLCATAITQLRPGTRTNYDRELVAQGSGNMLCGLLGALPMTGVIVRSSANIHAGAQTRLSAILHGIWLLLFVVAFASVLQMIPTASLAAVLVYTGYKLVDVKSIRKLWQHGWGEVAIYFATLTTIVAVDLLTGVIVGIALAAAKLLYTFSRLTIRMERDPRENRYQMRLSGAATFVRLPKLAAALEDLPSDAELHVDLDRLSYIDHACLNLLSSWAEQHQKMGGRLMIDWDSLHASAGKNGGPRLADGSEAA
jgi:MFS superfamily sulfate permease-like transporter